MTTTGGHPFYQRLHQVLDAHGFDEFVGRVVCTASGMTDRPSWAARIGPPMRMAALLVALSTVVVGVVGLVSPASVTAIRRQYFATPTGLYTAGAVRLAMGLVVILGATASRAPKSLRLLGALMCMQGLSATILGPEHARTVLEWETMRPALLRAGAIRSLFDVVGIRRSQESSELLRRDLSRRSGAAAKAEQNVCRRMCTPCWMPATRCRH